MNQKILIADDEESIRLTFSEFLDDAGFNVDTAETLSHCIAKMEVEAFDLLILDVMFGTESSLDAIRSLKALQPECQIVVMTGNPRLNSLVEAKKEGAVDYLSKPVRQASLLYNVRKILKL